VSSTMSAIVSHRSARCCRWGFSNLMLKRPRRRIPKPCFSPSQRPSFRVGNVRHCRSVRQGAAGHDPWRVVTYLDGERRYAMRIWLDPDRLAARRLTVQDVEEATRNQNASIPAGRIESDQTEFSVSLKGTLHTPTQFESLIVAYRDGYPVRLEDVARVELGAEDTRKLVRFNGRSSLGISVSRQSKANTLAVARAIKEQLPSISAIPSRQGRSLRVDQFDSLDGHCDRHYCRDVGLVAGLEERGHGIAGKDCRCSGENRGPSRAWSWEAGLISEAPVRNGPWWGASRIGGED
jgi:hypothetical protein